MVKFGRTAASAWVLTVEARCPPAEEPMIPMSSDVVRIQIPHICTIAKCLDSLERITHWDVSVTVWHAIFQHSQGDATRIEERSPIMPFVVHGKMRVTTTRTAHNSTSRRILRKIDSDFRLTICGVRKNEFASCLGKTHRERDEECKEKEDAFHKNVNERLNHYRCKVAKKCGNEQIFCMMKQKRKES